MPPKRAKKKLHNLHGPGPGNLPSHAPTTGAAPVQLQPSAYKPTSAGPIRVELGPDNEAMVRRALSNIPLDRHTKPEAECSLQSERDLAKLGKRLRAVFDALEDHGFKAAHIEQVLAALPPSQVSTPNALDWLCLHLPAEELPPKFSRGLRTAISAEDAAAVQVIAAPKQPPATKGAGGEATADDGGSGRVPPVADPAGSLAGLVKLQRESAGELRAQLNGGAGKGREALPDARAGEEGLAQKEAKAKAERAEWIRRYMEQQEEKDQEDEMGESGDDVIDDWELWSDPRQQQAQREQRKKVDPAARRAAIAGELQAAKAAAIAAKASGNKAKQAEAGRIVKQLKDEAAALGITEAELAAALEPVPKGCPAETSANMLDLTRPAASRVSMSPDEATASTNDGIGSTSNGGQEPRKATASLGLRRKPSTPLELKARPSAEGEAEEEATWEATWEHADAGVGPGGFPARDPTAESGAAGPDAREREEGGEEEDERGGRLPRLKEELPRGKGEEGGEAGEGEEEEWGDMEEDGIDAEGASQVAGPDHVGPGTTNQGKVGDKVMGNKVDNKGGQEEEDAGTWMFDDDHPMAGDASAATSSSYASSSAPADAVLTPWGLEAAMVGKGPKTKKGSKNAKPPPVKALQLPKAILQQACAKELCPAPRFERLTEEERRHSAWKPGYRYSVTVSLDLGRALSVDMGGRRAARKNKGALETFRLPVDDDGWPSIQEAQNAAATLALYSLAEGQPMYRVLEHPYQSLWLQWEKQGKQRRQQISDEKHKAKSELVESLLTSAAAAASSSSFSSNVASSLAAMDQPTPEVPQDSGAVPASSLEPSWEVAGGSHSSGTMVASTVASSAEAKEARRVADDMQARHSGRGARLLEEHRRRQRTPKYQKTLEVRLALPIQQIRDQLMRCLSEGDVVVVSGETGCGKTTQVPQFLLDGLVEEGRGHEANIICTQPRRIAAISIAERVAAERCEPPPGAAGSAVGYHVRLDAASHRDTQLLFCTTGILLRRLLSDSMLDGISHLIIDEVHERTLQGDFLMVIVQDLLQRRAAMGKPLKLVLMSATLDADLFAKYFGSCPVLSASGRSFPVEMHFLEDVYLRTGYCLPSDSQAAIRPSQAGRQLRASLANAVEAGRGGKAAIAAGWGDEEAAVAGTGECLNPHYDPSRYGAFPMSVRKNLSKVNEDVVDYDLLEELVAHIDASEGPGAILVFLPGIGEISGVVERLRASRSFGRQGHAAWVLALHSSLSPEEQRRVFLRPPEGIRKVVVSTNIAETSVTIPDVVFVVDSGKLKELRFDANRSMTCLVETWVARAGARQRKGRAGRVQPGKCFTLYTRHRFEQLMHEYQLPEMLRVPLEELCLQIKLLGLGRIAPFLQKAIQPPKKEAVQSAIDILTEVCALDAGEELTPLGFHLASLPVDVHLGKMMIYGVIFKCLDPVLSIAACLSHKSPFSPSQDQKDASDQSRLSFAASKPGTGWGDASQGDESDRGIRSNSASDKEAITAIGDNGAQSEDQEGTQAGGTASRPSKGGVEVGSKEGTPGDDTLSTGKGAESKKERGGGTRGAVIGAAVTAGGTAGGAAAKAGGAAVTGSNRADASTSSSEVQEVDLGRGQQSDHLVMAAAYNGWRSAFRKGGRVVASEYCRKNFLSAQTLLMLADMRRQFASLLMDIGFLRPPGQAGANAGGRSHPSNWDWLDDPSLPWNQNARKPAIIKAVLTAGMYPHIAAIESRDGGGRDAVVAGGGRPKWVDGRQEVFIHQTSVNHPVRGFVWPFMVFHEKLKTSKVFIRDCSVVTPYSLLVFGRDISVQHESGLVTVDGWIPMRAPAQTAVLFKQLQRALGAYLQEKVQHPQLDESPVWGPLITAVIKLLNNEAANSKPTAP